MPTYTEGSFLVDSVSRRLIEAGRKAKDIALTKPLSKKQHVKDADIVLLYNLLPVAVIETKSAVWMSKGPSSKCVLLRGKS